MAFLTPTYQQNSSTTARDDRLVLTSLVPTAGKAQGLDVGPSSTPGMSVVVQPGSAFVKVTSASYQGSWHVVSTTPETVPIDPADYSRKRIDKIVLQVRDTSFGDQENDALIYAVKGQPATSPAIPNTPRNSIVLATVTVQPKSTAITSAHIGTLNVEDVARISYSLAPQAVLCTSTDRPTIGLFDGMVIYETDTGITRFREGSSWKYLAGEKYGGYSVANVVESVEPGWTVSTANATIRAGTTQGYVTFSRNGSDISTGSSGNIGNRHICTLKLPFRPMILASATSLTSGRGAGGYIDNGGKLVLANVTPGNPISNGETFSLGFVGTVPSAFYSV